jgi:hypothetical protein
VLRDFLKSRFLFNKIEQTIELQGNYYRSNREKEDAEKDKTKA